MSDCNKLAIVVSGIWDLIIVMGPTELGILPSNRRVPNTRSWTGYVRNNKSELHVHKAIPAVLRLRVRYGKDLGWITHAAAANDNAAGWGGAACIKLHA